MIIEKVPWDVGRGLGCRVRLAWGRGEGERETQKHAFRRAKGGVNYFKDIRQVAGVVKTKRRTFCCLQRVVLRLSSTQRRQ